MKNVTRQLRPIRWIISLTNEGIKTKEQIKKKGWFHEWVKAVMRNVEMEETHVLAIVEDVMGNISIVPATDVSFMDTLEEWTLAEWQKGEQLNKEKS